MELLGDARRSRTYVVVGGADPHLAEVDGEDGVGARALDVHLGAGCGARQSAELQTLHHLPGETRSQARANLSNVFQATEFLERRAAFKVWHLQK